MFINFYTKIFMRLLLYSLLFLSLASCTTYNYITLDSSDVPLDRSKAFLWETDAITVAYQFAGEGGQMTVTVFNKSNQPLFVNWKKSAVIREGMMVSLFNRNVIASGAMSTESYRAGAGQTTGYSQFSVSFDVPEGIEFIPPQSGLSKTVVNLQAINATSFGVPLSVEREKAVGADGLVTKIRRVYYADEYSPFRFKTYLTLALGKNAENEFSVQHSFYVKEVMESTTNPFEFSMFRENGSQFWVARAPGY